MATPQQTDEAILADIADHYLAMTPTDFDDWLQKQCPVQQPETAYGLFLSAYLAGTIKDVDAWARDHATTE